MKVVILAGGKGTRLSEETVSIPKPMIEIGGKPMLWHIMKIYSHYGFNDFIILLGYKGYLIKEYFANYFLHQSDVTIDIANNKVDIHNNASEPWKVTLLDTGIDSLTGGRVLRSRKYIGEKEPFFLTYGDGVSNIDIRGLLNFHNEKGKVLTITSVQPEGRYGAIIADSDGIVQKFVEKPLGDGGWINGGFFVCNPDFFDYLSDGDQTALEGKPLVTLAGDSKIATYRHKGFWKCMDTQRDKVILNDLWENRKAEWKVW